MRRQGGIYVKAAGNGFRYFKQDNGQIYSCTNEPYGREDLSCQNATAEEENSRPEMITVGAFNAQGVKSSFSTAGSNLWISAPGGELGTDTPAILTTDQSGCTKGYSRKDLSPISNDFEIGDPAYNPQCHYSTTFNGTSAAVPSTSGAIALMLQVNPDLTRRDINHILAKTARKIDPNASAVTVSINSEDYLASHRQRRRLRLPQLVRLRGRSCG